MSNETKTLERPSQSILDAFVDGSPKPDVLSIPVTEKTVEEVRNLFPELPPTTLHTPPNSDHGHWAQDPRDGVWRYLTCSVAPAEHHETGCSWCSNPDSPTQPHFDDRCGEALLKRYQRDRDAERVRAMNAYVPQAQRAVVYINPKTGEWHNPHSNDPNDPIALRAREEGALPHEFYSVRDLRDFRRRLRKNDKDELTGYNEIIDMDEGSRKRDDTLTLERHMLHLREGRLKLAFEMLGGGKNRGRYERAQEELRRRGWK